MLDTRRISRSAYDSDANVSFAAPAGGVFCADSDNSRVNRDKFVYDGCGVGMTSPEVVQQLIGELRVLNSTWRLSSSKIEKYSGNTFSSATVRRYRNKDLIEY